MKFEKSDDMCVTFFSSQPTSAFLKGRRLWAANFGKMLAFFREGVDVVDTLRYPKAGYRFLFTF